jgi:hypothetical protein
VTLAAENHWISLGEVVPLVLARCAVGAMVTGRCESPIEVIFGASLLVLHPHVQFLEPEDNRDLTRPCLIPQFWWKQYRIDFALCAAGKPEPSVFVECDGHEFHSTDEQIARDRAKDAAALAAGIQMMRFSGTEIHRHYDVCASLAMAALARSA